MFTAHFTILSTECIIILFLHRPGPMLYEYICPIFYFNYTYNNIVVRLHKICNMTPIIKYNKPKAVNEKNYGNTNISL